MASSTEWEKRRAAVPLLVGLLGQQPVEEALLALLLDEDTAVTEETAGALLRNASAAALTIFARAWVVADEDDTLPQMNDHLYVTEPSPYDWPKIVRTLRELAESVDDEVREAAGTLLADLPEHYLRRGPRRLAVLSPAPMCLVGCPWLRTAGARLGVARSDRPDRRGVRHETPALCVGAGVDHPQQVRRRLVMSLPILVDLFAAPEAAVAPPKAGAGSES